MSIVDLLITIIVVAILVVIALGTVMYAASKLRAARRLAPQDMEEGDTSWFFVRYRPGTRSSRES